MNSPHNELLGSWTVEIKVANRVGPGLLTFTADGGVIGSESPLPFESTAHGSWVARASREVAYTCLALMGS